MGNEQSTSSASGVSSSISFLAGKRGTSVKRSTQIVVVRPGQDPVGDPADDAEIKKLREIRRFLPVLKSALPGMRDSPEVFAKVSSKPILKFCYRLQEHLAVCAKAISKEQASLHTTMKHVDHTCSVAVSKYQEAAEHTDKLAHAMKKIKSVNQKLLEAESILIALFPQAEELGQLLNEVLPPDQQLLPIQMPKVSGKFRFPLNRNSLGEQRTAVTVTNNVDRRVADGTTGAAFSASTRLGNHIMPVDEHRVVDRYFLK